MTPRLMKPLTLLFVLLMVFVIGPTDSFAEGTYEHPFSSDSIWNMPIADGVASCTFTLENFLAGLRGITMLDRPQPNNNHKNP